MRDTSRKFKAKPHLNYSTLRETKTLTDYALNSIFTSPKMSESLPSICTIHDPLPTAIRSVARLSLPTSASTWSLSAAPSMALALLCSAATLPSPLAQVHQLAFLSVVATAPMAAIASDPTSRAPSHQTAHTWAAVASAADTAKNHILHSGGRVTAHLLDIAMFTTLNSVHHRHTLSL